MRTGFWVVLFLSSVALATAEEVAAPTPEQAVARAREIEARFAALPSLRYRIECVTRDGRQSQTERWTFAYQAPDRIRIDTHEPLARTIVVGPDESWEYVPKARQALRTDWTKLSASEKAQRLAGVSARVAVDGLHPGTLPAEAPRVSVSPLDPGWWRLEWTAPRLRFDLDPARKVVVRSEVFTSENRLAVRTEAADFRETAPGFWFPGQIRCTYERDGSFVQRQIQLDQIEIGLALPAETFRFSPPDGIQVMGD